MLFFSFISCHFKEAVVPLFNSIAQSCPSLTSEPETISKTILDTHGHQSDAYLKVLTHRELRCPTLLTSQRNSTTGYCARSCPTRRR